MYSYFDPNPNFFSSFKLLTITGMIKFDLSLELKIAGLYRQIQEALLLGLIVVFPSLIEFGEGMLQEGWIVILPITRMYLAKWFSTQS